MQLLLIFEDQLNEIFIGALAICFLILILILQHKKQYASQKMLYEQSYRKQTLKEFEQNKLQLTKYHIQKLHENPKFQEWCLSQSKNN